MSEAKIYLTLLNGTGYVFDVDDYMTLRTNHRIVGAPVGTANSKGWSAHEATLPVELTKYETQLLIEKGIALIVCKSQALTTPPTPHQLEAYKAAFEARLTSQAETLKAEKLRETERHLDKIVAGKRNKLLKQGNAEQAAALTPEQVLQEIADNFCFERQNALVEVPCAHVDRHTAQLYQWPQLDTVQYRVFRDLWQRGKFVTTGDAFGADFLIYPSDPLLYHASHIVIVQETSCIRPLDFIAKVRLSVTVNKSCVFAYERSSGGEIVYQTVSWHNPK
ncbi:tRNA-splicing endonuclease subunit Sen34 [Scaptodrosophila lebanonensis]|uniref:tRNA-splicing endonuclease subunit Sen34 n=1 Tax=Drosophila lebanonensis TaxID=7225 RepID=A0A6J2UD19_DROLE|nr:tRNA-splicing endonuclease subunit Sen34 [Scaptodrosophila lebanonensis]